MTKPTLEQLLEEAKNHVWTERERREQIISFAYGNAKLDCPAVTKEEVTRAYAELHGLCRTCWRKMENGICPWINERYPA